MRFIYLLVTLASLMSSEALAQDSQADFSKTSTSAFFLQAGARTQGTFSRPTYLVGDNGVAYQLSPGAAIESGPEISLGLQVNRFTASTYYALLIGADGSDFGPTTGLQIGIRTLGHIAGPVHLGGFGHVVFSEREVPGLKYDQLGGQFGLDLGLVKDLGQAGRLELNHRVGCGPVRGSFTSDQMMFQSTSVSCSAGISLQVGVAPTIASL